MPRKNIYSILMILILISSCTQKESIVGNIEGLGNDTLYIRYLKIPKNFEYGERIRFKSDSIIVKNDKFTYDNIGNEPIIMEIRLKKGLKKLKGGNFAPSSLEIFLQLQAGEKVKIKGHKEKIFIDYSVEGSEISEEYNRLRKRKLDIMIERAALFLKRDTMQFNKIDKKKIAVITKELSEKRNLIKDIDLHYLDNNFDSHLTVYLLWYYGKLYKEHEKLSLEVRNGVNKPFIDYEILRHQRKEERKRIKELGLTKEGKIAQDFTLKTIEGSSFNLHEANYEYMVLDFWGSWCVPCVQGFPKMKEYYKKYSKRVEFIGIACKDKEDKWKQSVKKHNVNWTQLFNGTDKTSDVSLKYAIALYPTKIILNKEKKIVGIFEGESDTFYKKLDELMKSN